jgi:nucleoside triphosphate diphosphatase
MMSDSAVSSMEKLLTVMAALRDPESGCPWDVKQTYASIVPYTLEEAYEVADAIERGDLDELRDELGDLLFQVVFYSQMAKEEGRFDFDQVAAGIVDKMLRRHPHVFGDASYENDEALRHAWESTKASEREAKGQNDDTSQLAGVTLGLPALTRAHKLQKRAADVGFDWPDAGGAFDKVREEIDEVQQALEQADRQHIEEELGDLLFAMVNVVRLLGFHAEHTLRRASNKFERRFRAMESLLAEQGSDDLRALSLERLEAAWEAIKRQEKE